MRAAKRKLEGGGGGPTYEPYVCKQYRLPFPSETASEHCRAHHPKWLQNLSSETGRGSASCTLPMVQAEPDSSSSMCPPGMSPPSAPPSPPGSDDEDDEAGDEPSFIAEVLRRKIECCTSFQPPSPAAYTKLSCTTLVLHGRKRVLGLEPINAADLPSTPPKARSFSSCILRIFAFLSRTSSSLCACSRLNWGQRGEESS